ncbi:LPXTG cell wall anchor domain-containing protein [Streptomyces flavofungini]|uniref:LPXTG cell wall anchor domain-containing protein n=1 Tax=Streptomyces flavofungini TaxID=68200 RepID=UPI0025B1003B|nr:LPXTG cell wall anchor domain-containing protein [Streptomyces flavofungini]WJV46728.1 LPXTG cell wall anchor domain-containing protein [Streptomyces flavofungini]
MKLRRALAAAAATAVIAPLALLSAPAAFATEDVSTTPSANATPPAESPGPEDPAEPGDGTKPGDGDTEPEDPTKPDDPAEPGDGTEPGEGDAKPGDDTEPGDSDAKPGDGDTDPGDDTEPGEDTTGPGDETTPTDEPTECPVDDESGEDAANALELKLKGLPGKIVAGSGWHEFKLIAANPSDEDLGKVRWLAAADNFSESEDEKDWLSSYTRIQFYDPEAKGWKSIVDEVESGVTFGTTTLAAKEQVEIRLRLNINKKAPAGDGYAFGLGGYVDSELNCEHNAFAFFDFTVLKPGSDNEHPGEAIPRPDVTEPPAAKKPQGGRADEVKKTVADIPPTGSLAQTGSSSALPTIGIVGGIAVVAGAGAVYVVRRRSNSDAAA